MMICVFEPDVQMLTAAAASWGATGPLSLSL